MTKYPVLILKKLVLFPNQEVKLELSNEISKKIINLATKNHNNEILVVAPIDVMEAKPLVSDLPNIGVIGNLKTVIKLSNDNVRVVIKGIKRTYVEKYGKYDKLKGILKATTNDLELPKLNNIEELAVKRKLRELIKTYIKNNNQVSNSILTLIDEDNSLDKISDIITSFIPLNLSKKLFYMQEINPITRSKKLIDDLSVEIEINKIEESIDEKVRNNFENNQKEFILKEKIKVINEELGNNNEKEKEILNYYERLNNLELDSEIKQKLTNDIKKLEYLSDNSSEIGLIRNFLETVLDLPWNKKSEEEQDIKIIKEKLNSTHYGLENVKTRVIEYIQMKKRNKNLNSPIICLVGPPGVGKTTLAKSIASSLNRKYFKISVGGLNDSAELIGHRKTYLGSYPGKIISGIRKCNANNPLILIDEVDKMIKDYKGDPASTLLDILDKEQNKHFIDNYLDIEFDLSNSLFILTANNSDYIPSVLRDRLEIININSYTIFEKVDIAKKYLLPTIYENYNVKDIIINDGTINQIINDYTCEFGVRELNRILDSLVRKLIIKKTMSKKIDLTKILGVPKYENVNEKLEEIGVINALGCTLMGGNVLKIECSIIDGENKLITTGNIETSVKECIDVSLTYLKSMKKEFKLKENGWKNKDIHIHFNNISVLKDGGSGGIAITSSLLSALLEHKIDNKIGFTGEMSIKGEILKVAGIKEKIIAAYNDNLEIVFIPKSNHYDLLDIPKKVSEKVKIIEVSNYLEIYKYLFIK